jgi:hypothetical protein
VAQSDPDDDGEAEDGQDTAFVLTIDVTGNNPAQIPVGADYSDMGATATNPDGNDLSITTWIDGTEVQNIDLDTSTDITYTIEYRAEWEGETATATREVIVGEGTQEQADPAEEGDDASGSTGDGADTGDGAGDDTGDDTGADDSGDDADDSQNNE